MEMGELVAVAMDAPHNEEGCPFCRPEEEVSHQNELGDDFDEDANNDIYNDAGTLGRNLKDSPHNDRGPLSEIPKGEKAPVHDMEIGTTKKREWHHWVYDAGLVPVAHGAHHLIPGNAALKKSSLYKNGNFGQIENGSHKTNIGYNVNSRNNGVWLPGSYSIRTKEGTSQVTWSETNSKFQEAYAYSAMADTGRQFHDTHTAYSSTVKKALSDLNKYLKKMEKEGCPNCGKGKDKAEPHYHLNSRLNAVSKHLASLLTDDPLMWKDNFFASDKFGESFRDFVKKEGDLEKAKIKIAEMRNNKFGV
ncbi:MAG: AHH domain-containing protein [Pseudomonadales bacterium]|nr:AHH domain-containing protein [Pseudomonadales bacterium]